MAKIIGSIKKSSHFAIVSKYGRAVYSKPLKIISSVLPESEQNPDLICVGFKISKKLGNAVTRNKIRRRLKAIVYSIASAGKISLPQNLLFIPNKNILSYSFSNIEKVISHITRKITK